MAKPLEPWEGPRTGDCLNLMRRLPDNCVDLVFCSPSYEAQRTYGIGFDKVGGAWVEWAVARYIESVRISRGLVAWVVEGHTKKFRWSATPAMLMADLHRGGVSLRKPPIYQRNGIPGSGGTDWWRNDYEFVVCASKGKLPWNDNTAMGHPPKCAPGGAPSHHSRDGRVNKPRLHAKGGASQGSKVIRQYKPPVLANPGNVTNCGAAGGGNMGSRLSAENEAAFPESLVEAYVRSFCPPGGIVFDPFMGSGTTLAVAKKWGRRGMGCDVRKSQTALTKRRLDLISFGESMEVPDGR